MKVNLSRELEKGNHYYELPLTEGKLADPKNLGKDGKPSFWQRVFSENLRDPKPARNAV
jgi:hypothetical protein